MPGNSFRLLFVSLISSTSDVFRLSIIQLLAKSVAIVLSLFRLHVLIIIPMDEDLSQAQLAQLEEFLEVDVDYLLS